MLGMGCCEHTHWHSDFMKKDSCELGYWHSGFMKDCCEHGYWHSGCKKRGRFEYSYWHSGFMKKDCCDHSNWLSSCIKTDNLTSWTVVTFSWTSLNRVVHVCLFFFICKEWITSSDVFDSKVRSWSLIYISQVSPMTSWSNQFLKSMDFVKFKVHVQLILTGKVFYVFCIHLRTKLSSQKHFFNKCLMFKFEQGWFTLNEEWTASLVGGRKKGWNYDGGKQRSI